MNDRRALYAHLVLLALLIVVILFVVERTAPPLSIPSEQATTTVATTTERALDAATSTATTTPVQATTTPATTTPKAKKASIKAVESPAPEETAQPRSPNDIVRIENPYSTPPFAFETVNVAARAALVNIYCSTPSGGALKPITGSGSIIDPRGIVLTNAHVAQYVLIAQSGKSDLACTVRTGAPAVSKWIPTVMYIPPVWVDIHATEITQSRALGTGEHDYALLYLSATLDGSPLPTSYPYVAPDAREAIAFVEDAVLTASYPVEFVGGGVIQSNLYPVTSITSVRQLLTFSVGYADAISLGGVIGAQSGSSGGGVINQWNRLVGLITTTSEGSTTGSRDLHAVTTAYIDRDLTKQTGFGLTTTLSKDPQAAAAAFSPTADVLAQKLINVILGR